MKKLYPDDYNPSERGRCEVCGVTTKGWTRQWLALCPKHWHELIGLKWGN